jgi:two-component system response regulator RegX3
MSPNPPIPVLVVEDEKAIRRGLCDVLAFHGYEPTPAETGEEGLREGRSGLHALVLLDVMLPGLSGFEVCETLRAERPDLPILMLTARGSEEDVLRGFRSGSDDYVTKPFSVSELLARVEALLRRSGRLTSLPAVPFHLGGWHVDPEQRCARREEEAVELTRREVEMLALFVRERGRIVSRRRLLREVWGLEAVDRIETRTVDMHIAKLRRKLGDARSWIETVRGEGYRLSG